MIDIRDTRIASGLFLLACLALGACNFGSDDDGERDGNDGGGSTVALQGGVSFSILDTWVDPEEVSEPVILLEMQTDKKYADLCHELVADVDDGPDSVIVRLRHVFVPEDPGACASLSGPATYRDTLALEPGAYHLAFEYGAWRDPYELGVTDSTIYIVGADGAFTTPLVPLAWRVPPLSFVYECRTTDAMAWVSNDFADSLAAVAHAREFSFAGPGVIPYPSYEPGSSNQYRYFVYDAESDYVAAGALLERYMRNVVGDDDGVVITLLNWRREGYYSWPTKRPASDREL